MNPEVIQIKSSASCRRWLWSFHFRFHRRIRQGLLEATSFLAALKEALSGLSGFLNHESRATLRAALGDWFVPRREIAIGVCGAAVECPTTLCLFYNDIACAALRAADPRRFLLDVLALWIVRTRCEG